MTATAFFLPAASSNSDKNFSSAKKPYERSKFKDYTKIDKSKEIDKKDKDVEDEIILMNDRLFRKGIKLMLEGFFSYAYEGTFQ
ncbi:MAG: hypothetical protein J6I40_07875 [Mailhella sp.]|nr:hypothetical protein [Mailhella sp.]